MSWFSDKEENLSAKGIDYDLWAAFENNSCGIKLDDIAQVLAVWEGENDGARWRWIVRLENGEFWFVQGGCDYTGWDCQSWLDASQMHNLNDIEIFEDSEDVIDNLRKQLLDGKHIVWTEAKTEEMQLDDVPMIDLNNYPNLADLKGKK